MAITIGLKTSTQVFICSEMILADSIIKEKDDERHTTVFSNTLLNITGTKADAFRLKDHAIELSKYYNYDRKVDITPSLVANICSRFIYNNLRRDPKECQAIIGGLNEKNNLELYCIDRYGAKHEDNFCVTGYGLYFLFGIYDMAYNSDMSEEESISLLMNCLKVLKERLLLETSKWSLDILDLNGARNQVIDFK